MKNIKTLREKHLQIFSLKCCCGCGAIEINLWDNPEDEEDPCIFMNYVLPAFYAYQETAWSRFKKRFSLIWCAITGKDFSLFELTLTMKQWRDFTEFVSGTNYLKKNKGGEQNGKTNECNNKINK